MKSPLANAFATSLFAISTSCSGSAVEAITRSTGKSPPPGSGCGVSGITRTPGICESLPADLHQQLLRSSSSARSRAS